MDRLTSRQVINHADGTTHVETYCHGHRYGPAAFPGKYGSSYPQEYLNYCEMVDRLAAYEDTGMTPEEVAALRAEVERLRAALIEEMADVRVMLRIVESYDLTITEWFSMYHATEVKDHRMVERLLGGDTV